MKLTDKLTHRLAMLKARWYFRCADVLGAGVHVRGHMVAANHGGEMKIGNGVAISSTISTTQIVAEKDGLLEIGSDTFINYGCSISASQHIHIGKGCHIGTYTIIMDNDFHHVQPEKRHERPQSKPITLEDNVWLGTRVIVLKGVTIGAGSVVGSGAVVTKDIPPRSLAAGVPAKVLRTI